MDRWTVKWTYQCTADDGRVTAETYVGWIDQKYENESAFVGLKNEKFPDKVNSDPVFG